jgi:hypothetical protein
VACRLLGHRSWLRFERSFLWQIKTKEIKATLQNKGVAAAAAVGDLAAEGLLEEVPVVLLAADQVDHVIVN